MRQLRQHSLPIPQIVVESDQQDHKRKQAAMHLLTPCIHNITRISSWDKIESKCIQTLSIFSYFTFNFIATSYIFLIARSNNHTQSHHSQHGIHSFIHSLSSINTVHRKSFHRKTLSIYIMGSNTYTHVLRQQKMWGNIFV